jgi:AIG2 family protein
MPPLSTEVFFYGLFMDIAVLEAKGIKGSAGRRGVVRDWALRIGNRATLVPERGRAVHGILMSLPLPDLERLYQDGSVQLYRPVAVLVEQEAVTARPALAYVLSEPPQPEERNPEYAAKLRALAERIGLPGEYVASIT